MTQETFVLQNVLDWNIERATRVSASYRQEMNKADASPTRLADLTREGHRLTHNIAKLKEQLPF